MAESLIFKARMLEFARTKLYTGCPKKKYSGLIHNNFQTIEAIKLEQDACTGVHSACRREENGHNLDICVLRRLRLRQGQMQGFLGLKWGGGS